MIGKRLAGDLPAGDPAAVGERGEVDRVDLPALLEDVEHLIDPFIDKRDGADLNADRLARLGGRLVREGGGDGGRRRQPCGPFQKITAVEGFGGNLRFHELFSLFMKVVGHAPSASNQRNRGERKKDERRRLGDRSMGRRVGRNWITVKAIGCEGN